MLASELARRQQGRLTISQQDDPFIFSPQMVQELELMMFAAGVLTLVASFKPTLPSGQGGRPAQYRDTSILVTILVMVVWQISPEAMIKRMKRWPDLALACGYPPGQVISSSQLRRRRDALGLGVYFITFCSLVLMLIRRGVVNGRDWVIDSTIIDAFSAQDGAAGWSFTKRYGYKVHLLICRDSLLPIMVMVSPANANDAPWATRLMAVAHALFALPVQVVRADAAYFTKAILTFIIVTLKAVPKVVHNPRRAGKKALTTLQWVAEYRQDRGKRGYIERLFAVLKCYYRLNSLQSNGLWPAYRHALEVCFACLLIAWLADHLGRPDLTHARSRLIAPC